MAAASRSSCGLAPTNVLVIREGPHHDLDVHSIVAGWSSSELSCVRGAGRADAPSRNERAPGQTQEQGEIRTMTRTSSESGRSEGEQASMLTSRRAFLGSAG